MVLGASIAGLSAAGALAARFDEVVVVDKDARPESPAPRRGVPQGTHVHGLQPHALTLLNGFFPGVSDTLANAGAVSIDFGENVRAYLADGWVESRSTGRAGLSLTRPFLEFHTAAHAAGVSNIEFAWEHRVRGLAGSDSAVTGVHCDHAGESRLIEADLVVDATGRGTRSAAWLRELGFGELAKSSVYIDVRYVTCNYARPPDDFAGYLVRHYPHHKLGAALLPIENDQWLLSLSGRFGVYARKDHAGFLASAAELPISEVHDLLAGLEPTTAVTAYNFAHNERRHYERLERAPVGFVALGDSVLALNPLYGQGMTSAAAQAELLGRTVGELAAEGVDAPAVSEAFIARQAAFVDEPWHRAQLGDTIFAEAHGDLPDNLEALRTRDRALAQLAGQDREVGRILAQVTQFAAPASDLARPDIVARVDEIVATQSAAGLAAD